MVIVFDISTQTHKVRGVYWEEGESFAGKHLVSDGSLEDISMPGPMHISELVRELAGGQGHAYPAEVDDIRSGLKYLGKSSDLAEMLPQVDVWKDAPRPELDNDWKSKYGI